MAEVAVNILIEKLLPLALETFNLIDGLPAAVDQLVSDLQLFRAFLKDVAQREVDSAGWKQSVRDIRVAVYKAEDAIDRYLVQRKLQEDKNPVWQKVDFINLYKLKGLAEEIKERTKYVGGVRLNNQHLLKALQLNTIPPRAPTQLEYPVTDEDDVVGFDGEADEVIRRLLQESESESEDIVAVPIVGMAGLGKSTLAKKVSKDPRITHEFVKRVWVKVPRPDEKKDTSFQKKAMLLSVLTAMTEKAPNELASYTEDKLENGVRSYMESAAKCLIILDDVWDTELMNLMKYVAPTKSKNHRIIATTRDRNVAVSFNEHPHQPDYLDPENSWKLLKKKVFKNESCRPELEETGRRIAGKCNGLPLALVVIAGALTIRTTTHWELVNESVGERLLDRNNPHSCFEFVRKSYDSLSYDQKACFLYCAAFPRGFDIPARKLIRLWLAEGFIDYSGALDLEKKAMEYLNDLANRSLVIITGTKCNGQIKTCRLHDVLYEFCQKEASEEDLFQEIRSADQSSTINQVSETTRRLTVQSTVLQKFLSGTQFRDLVRSFLCFDSTPVEMHPNFMRKLYKGFPMLRVLDVQPVEFLFDKYLNRLFHLRYIALSGNFDTLPSSLDELWNVQTIIIYKSSKQGTLQVEADIWKMPQLRHFQVNVPAILPSPRDDTKNSDCTLHTISLITPESCREDIFGRARFVRKLGVCGDPSALLTNNNSGMNEIAKTLENLKLVNDGPRRIKILRTSDVLFKFPQSLKKLTLSGTWLEWSNMAKLGQLQLLEVLKLKENAFTGEYWEPEIGGFTRLMYLWIERTNLVTWEASQHCFPLLMHLTLKLCNELQEIPNGLALISNLQEINLELVNKTVVDSARFIKDNKQGYPLKLSVPPHHMESD